MMEPPDNPTMMICPYCDGSRYDDGDPMTPCLECNGTGEVETDAEVYVITMRNET